MSQSVTLKTAYRFFLPLILMTELNAISKSVIHAALARSETPSVTLAAFSIAFTFYYSIASATEVALILTISYLKDRRSLRRLFRFFVLLISLPFLLGQITAFTSLGDWVYGELFGASAAAVVEAKFATFLFSLATPILVGRAIAFGILMRNNRTILITYSTLVRLSSLAVSLVVLPHFLSGAALGAAALSTCIFIETIVAWCFALPYFRALPSGDAEPPRTRELWQFAWPLMLNQSAEIGVVFIINIFLGRLFDPDLALAAFGIVHGLVGLIFSPLRNLNHTAQTLARTENDRRVLRRFALQLVVGFAVCMGVIFHSPLADWVLGTVMGLSTDLAEQVGPAMKLALIMAAFWGFSALFRGLLAGARSTTMLAATGISRFALAGVVGALALPYPGLNGAVLGLLAWVAGYASEVAILWRRLRRLDDVVDR